MRQVTYDQEKVKKLRACLIEDSLAVFNDETRVEKWSQYRKDLLMKYASRVLPTLHAGREDSERLIPVPILGNVQEDNGDNQDNEDEGEDTGGSGRNVSE